MTTRSIFVFGSNLSGIHGAGSAKFAAVRHGAEYGVGHGLTGNAYAIPTKARNFATLPLDLIEEYVKIFTVFAREHPEMTFNVVRVGCGLAGYSDSQMAPMFLAAGELPNVNLAPEWVRALEHADHGRGNEAGPFDPDCPCRGTEQQPDCARTGCGFCLSSNR